VAGVTLDTGALIAIERGDPRLHALLDEAAAIGADLAVPAAVVAQAWPLRQTDPPGAFSGSRR
jgi:hypothetical protein